MTRETRVDDKLGSDSDEIILFKYSITSYGADYPVDSLVQRIAEGDIFVPSFQRGYVWSVKQASKFVESLLLGLPVPGIFLSKEDPTQKLLVIDGQQRLRTLQYFYQGIFVPTRKEFALRSVQPQFRGVTYRTLKEEDRRRLNDSIIHATIIKQDEPSDDFSSIYYIFERLNTGGTLLSSQEIRAAIYHGEFDAALRQLNMNDHWRAIYGRISRRMRDQELILRFFALHYNDTRYRKPMKEFLNKYMASNRHLQRQSLTELEHAFSPTIDLVYGSLGKNAFRPRRVFTAAVFDSVMVGLARRLAKGPVKDLVSVRKAYSDLVHDARFMEASERATANDESVKLRLKLASQAFAGIE